MEKELTKKIKSHADTDKKKHRTTILENNAKDTDQKKRWEGIKSEKRSYTPNSTKLKDIRGNRVPHGSKAEATAEFLEQNTMD